MIRAGSFEPALFFKKALNFYGAKSFLILRPIETMCVFGLENAVVDWIGETPDHFQSFNGSNAGTLT
jgi:hypothetical protein